MCVCIYIYITESLCCTFENCRSTMKSESESPLVVSNSLWPHGLHQSMEFSRPDTGVSSLSLLQGIFPTQGSNPGLLHCRWILYQLSHQGSPRKLEWIAYPFSRGTSQPRNWTRVSCIAGRFLTSWAIQEAHKKSTILQFKKKRKITINALQNTKVQKKDSMSEINYFYILLHSFLFYYPLGQCKTCGFFP